MSQQLILKKQLRNKLEVLMTFLLGFYYMGPNLPQPIIQVWALLGFLIIPVLIIARWKRFIWVATRDLPLLLLTLAVPLSVLWSTTPNSTLEYSRAFLYSTAFGIYLATSYTPKSQMRLMIWLLGIAICLNLIVPIVIPSYGIDFGYQDGPAWQGITRHKNELSGAMAMCGTFFLTISIYGSRNPWAGLSMSGIAFIIIMFTRGKGSLGLFIGLLPLLAFYKIVKQEYKLRTLLMICALMIVAVITITTLVNLEFIVVDLLNKDLGANGRSDVWDYLIQRGLEKPWLGYGYAGFWNEPAEGLGVALKFPWIGGAGSGGGNAHSSYVDVFLQLGWLGISLIAFSFFTVLIRVILLLVLTKEIEYFWMLQFLLFLAINSSYESYGGFLAYRHLFWVLYVSYVCSTALQFNKSFTRHSISEPVS